MYIYILIKSSSQTLFKPCSLDVYPLMHWQGKPSIR